MNTESINFDDEIKWESDENQRCKTILREEIAEECSLAIAKLITNELEVLDISPSTIDDLYDNIIKIIKGR